MALELSELGSFRRRALVVGVVVAILLVLVGVLPIREWLAELAAWLQSAGLAGMVGFGALYALLTVGLVPRAALNLLAGMVYGLVGGTVVAVLASMTGAWLAFVVGRTFLKELVRGAGDRSRVWRALDTVAQRHPIRLTTLWHFSLVLPFSFINYWMGGSEVRTRDFLVGKAIGVFPATAAYVWMGTLIPDVLSLASGELPAEAGGMRAWLLGGGVLMTVVLMVWLGRAAMRALEALAEADAAEGPVPATNHASPSARG